METKYLRIQKIPYIDFSSNQRISQRAVRPSRDKQFDPSGPTASQGVSAPEFLKRSTATWGSGPPAPSLSPHLLDPPIQINC